MIRIRTGASWRDDPRVAAALRAAAPAARAAAARELTDALAIEVDGVDLAAGRAEAPLLPSLEDLLRAISQVVSGAPQAAVVLGDGGLELLVRRRAGESTADTAKLAVRFIDFVIANGPFRREIELQGPDGEVLRVKPAAFGKLATIERGG